MIKLSRAAREAIDLSRNGSLGRKFPTWDEMVKEADGDFRKLAGLISLNYGRSITERDVRAYSRLYKISIRN